MNKTLDTEELSSVSRRDFFRKTASVSTIAAAAVLAPSTILADDENIMHHPKWGTTLGDELNKYPYGIPSKYEHNIVRRTSSLMSSAGDMHAAVSMSPLADLEGIITPNGLFFSRSHAENHEMPN
jgi:sulfane dehydrogenase subunit SoxC